MDNFLTPVVNTIVDWGNDIGDFVSDRFSTPEKASNTLSAVGWFLDAGAAYFGGVAVGLSIPSFGISLPTAGTVAAVLGIMSIPFHGAVILIDIFNEG